jgi:hypothetical protein
MIAPVPAPKIMATAANLTPTSMNPGLPLHAAAVDEENPGAQAAQSADGGPHQCFHCRTLFSPPNPFRLHQPILRESRRRRRPDDMNRMPHPRQPRLHKQDVFRVWPGRQEQDALRIAAGQDLVKVLVALPIGGAVDYPAGRRGATTSNS